MIKKLLSFSLLLGFFLLSACASDSKYAVRRPFLYEVQKGSQKGYLFGTIHLGISDEDLPENFWPYFDGADSYAFESNLTRGNEAEFLSKFMFSRNPKKKLSELMSASDYKLFRTLLHQKMEQYENIILEQGTPFGAYSALIEMQGEAVRLPHGEYVRLTSKFMLDRALEERAQKNAHPMSFLDGSEDQWVGQCITETQDYYLKKISQMLRSPYTSEAALNELRKMLEAYRSGQASEVLLQAEPALDRCFIVERNQLWMNSLIGLFESYDRPFVSVGLAHIEAPSGSLIQLLKERGFQIKRLELNP